MKESLEDAKKEKMYGAAVVPRKGSFMADEDLFIKHGFGVVDTYPLDFELPVKKFDNDAPTPKCNKESRKSR